MIKKRRKKRSRMQTMQDFCMRFVRTLWAGARWRWRLNLVVLLVFLTGFIAMIVASEEPATHVLTWQDGEHTHEITLELALTPQERARGLQNRQYLAAQAGMLFVFSQPQIAHFWMKDTFIPLDMLFLDSRGRIVHIAPDNQPHDLRLVSSPRPVKAVLEVNAGKAQEWGLQPGHTFSHPFFE